MKKPILLFFLVLGITFFFFSVSCRHEIPLTCSTVNFKIAVVKTDAMLNYPNGAIFVTASGGTGFQYCINGSSFQDTGYFPGLIANHTYIVVGHNSIGCTDSVSVDIGSHDPCQGVTITVTTTKVDASPGQSNGSITATASGGSGFTYSLNGGAFQANNIFTNLPAGTYNITAQSISGCLGTTQIQVGTNDPCAGVNVVVTETHINPVLNQSNRSITASATGGTGFTYSINGSAFQASGTFSNLAAGTYTITAKTSAGCISTKQITLSGVDPCAGVTIVVTTTHVNPTTGQSNGSITATATGSTGFTYSLNAGAFQASGVFNNLATGNYVVTAKNSNGCTGTTTVALGSTNPCAGVTITVTATHVNPFLGQSNGSITATASGGTGFTYSLNSGAYQASGTFNNLAAGTYSITAHTPAGCIGTTQVALVATDPCAGINIVVTTTQVNPTSGQSNGSITATATGSTGFTYNLNGGTYQASGMFNNLAAGTYTITAKNPNGCTGTKQVTLTTTNPCTNVNIVITTAVINTLPCGTQSNNGSITVTASGSTGFTYNINGGTYQSGNVFSALNAANYLIGVKDANGCTNTQTVTVGVAPRGPTFGPVRSLISQRCGSCHLNGGNSGGYNFDSDCSIISKWSQINKACVTYQLIQMPPSQQLTAAEKALITNWVNAGHGYSN